MLWGWVRARGGAGPFVRALEALVETPSCRTFRGVRNADESSVGHLVAGAILGRGRALPPRLVSAHPPLSAIHPRLN